MTSRNNKPGRIVKGTAKTPSLKDASGVWSLDEAMQAHRANAWPQPNLFQPVANSLRTKNYGGSSTGSYGLRFGGRASTPTQATFSGWIKRGNNSVASDYWIFGSNQYNTSSTIPPVLEVQFKGNNGGANDHSLTVAVENLSISYYTSTSALFRDMAAWYHIHVAYDSTQTTNTNRIKIWINGVQLTAMSGSSWPPQGTVIGTQTPSLGCLYLNGAPTRFFDGQMAEINFIDGYAIQPSLFGKFDTNNTWVPIAYTGSYGTNGFYLPFTNATTSQTLGYDASLTGTATYDADQDPYRGSVALHLTGNGPAGGNNNTFADSSTNNYAVTRSGSPTQGSFSPFPFNTNSPYNPATHGASAYFNGTTDYLTSATGIGDFGTSDFTVEYWAMNDSTNPTNYCPQVGTLADGTPANTWRFGTFGSNGRLYLATHNGTSFTDTVFGTTVYNDNCWHHYALIRTSGSVKAYVDGVQVGSTTSMTTNLTSGKSLIVGREGYSPTYYKGYISNLRIIKNVALYTANFTPAMRPFGTLTNNLLTFSEDFTGYGTSQASVLAGAIIAPDGTPSGFKIVEDTSNNQHGINAGPTVSSGVTYTGSYYIKAAERTQAEIIFFGSSATGGSVIGSSFNLVNGTVTNSTASTTSTIVSAGNGWWRCSVTYTTVGAGVMNVNVFSSTSTTVGGRTYQGNGTSGIFAWGAQLEAASSMGNYTPTPANFSTAPSLLLNFANAAVTDSAGAQNFATTTNATISAASKYGQGALYFDGSASTFLSTPYSDRFLIGSSNYTVEFWCNLSAYGEIVGAFNLTSPFPGWLVNVGNFGAGGGTIGFFHANATVNQTVNSTNTVPLNTWTHVAVVKQDNFLKMFINGRLDSSHSLTLTSTGSGQQINIGSDANSLTAPGRRITGLLDDLRITKGVARYWDNFAPPARALPETGGKSFATVNVNAGVVKSFTTVGTTSWTAPVDVTQIEVLVVAGGGGSGGAGGRSYTNSSSWSGGGGGGGVIYNSQYAVTPGQTYTVTVGAGGGLDSNGGNSVFGNVTAIGGGAGGDSRTSGDAGSAGGSGGGGGGDIATAGGAGTAGQGFAGGEGQDPSPEAAGGGGGAGGVGAAGSGTGAGGIGLQFGISGTPTYYAGGGGGGAGTGPKSTNTGGLGGGGNGSTLAYTGASNSTAGTANTGGGGGGGPSVGGSGLVIVRYTTTAVGNTSDATTDNLVDSPTQYGHDSGLGGEVVGNYCTLNPLNKNSGVTVSNGNLTFSGASVNQGITGTIAVSSGKWYYEASLVTISGSAPMLGFVISQGWDLTYVGNWSGGYAYEASGSRYYNGGSSAYSGASSYTVGDIIGVALDLTAGTLSYYKNGVSQGVAFSGLSGTFLPAISAQTNTWNVNFGQRAWAYAPPQGYNALTTKNLPRPAVGSAAATPNQFFDAVTWTQGATDVAITNAGGFQPDLVWIKSRSNSQNHYLMDSVRGTTGLLRSNGTGVESTGSTWITFNSNGFTPSSANTVTNTYTYVGWQWKAGGAAVSNTAGAITSQVSANTASGFSIVTWTGTGTGASVGHGLSAAPELIITKVRNQIDGWYTYTTVIDGSMDYFFLNTNAAKGNSGLAVPTSTVFYNDGWSASYNMVAYCFHSVAGYSKIGTYVGNGNADGPFVYLGFTPRFILVKKHDSADQDWYIWDTARSSSGGNNALDFKLYPNQTFAENGGAGGGESTSTNNIDAVSNGFKLRSANAASNASGASFIYMAFAGKPFGNVNGTAR